jgi:hypothetical protein
MNKNLAVFLFALCPLIPAASRFAYGIRKIINKIDPSESGRYIELVCLSASATVFLIVLHGLFPSISVSLGIYIYLSALSYLLLKSIEVFTLKERSFLPIPVFIPILLVFSGIREIIGFGTISVPVPTGLLIVSLLPDFQSYGLGFLGTAGGALILLGLFAWFVKFLSRRITTFKRNA